MKRYKISVVYKCRGAEQFWCAECTRWELMEDGVLLRVWDGDLLMGQIDMSYPLAVHFAEVVG